MALAPNSAVNRDALQAALCTARMPPLLGMLAGSTLSRCLSCCSFQASLYHLTIVFGRTWVWQRGGTVGFFSRVFGIGRCWTGLEDVLRQGLDGSPEERRDVVQTFISQILRKSLSQEDMGEIIALNVMRNGELNETFQHAFERGWKRATKLRAKAARDEIIAEAQRILSVSRSLGG